MCGICGVVGLNRSLGDPGNLERMRDSMAYRGPDDAGLYVDDLVSLGSRRLAILDLSPRGHMPMNSADGRYWITYNGEIYNYRELRVGLEARGYSFRSNTDTEVLVNLFAADGPAMLDRLNGMFALAIWDSRERRLFLARDHVGIKPLYYAARGGALYFASEQKALFAAGVPLQFDNSTWDELLCFRYVAGERTPFVGVKRLLPGHYMIWENGASTTRRWWHLAERVQAQRERLPANAARWYRETLDDSVDLRRIADVPVGVLLSGGLDSSSVAAALALQAGSRVASFTVRFRETGYDEGPVARQVARRWDLEHHEMFLETDELLGRLSEVSRLNDEPLVHASDVHLWSIARYAKPRVTVLLSGEGADETLGGYVRYQYLRYPGLLRAARPVLPGLVSGLKLDGRVSKLSRFLRLSSAEQLVLYNACEILPAELSRVGYAGTASFAYREQVAVEASALYPRDYMRQAMYLDQHTYLCSILDRNDRTTMGASIECRVPFLDRRLVETLAALPSSVLLKGTQTKQMLRQACADRLPDAVKRHRKWGFGVPWSRYLRDIPELREVVTRLHDVDPIRDSPLARDRVRQLARNFLAGDPHDEALVRQLVMIAVWYQAYFATPVTA